MTQHSPSDSGTETQSWTCRTCVYLEELQFLLDLEVSLVFLLTVLRPHSKCLAWLKTSKLKDTISAGRSTGQSPGFRPRNPWREQH